jgi:hypothetical protein
MKTYEVVITASFVHRVEALDLDDARAQTIDDIHDGVVGEIRDSYEIKRVTQVSGDYTKPVEWSK